MIISIIIAVYNDAEQLREQLQAMRAQDYDGEWEVLVVDNRSTDHLAEVIAEVAPDFPQLRFMRADERQGRAYASHIATRHAHGDAFVFCDADDIVAPGWLAAMARALHEHDFVAGELDTKTLNAHAPWRPPARTGAKAPILGFLPHASGCNLGVSRRAYDAVGGFDILCGNAQDVDLSWRLILHGFPLYDEPDAIVYYRYRTTIKKTWRQIFHYAQAHVWLYKHYAAHGMPRDRAENVRRRNLRILTSIPKMVVYFRRSHIRHLWLSDIATTAGHLIGSWKYRCWYP